MHLHNALGCVLSIRSYGMVGRLVLKHPIHIFVHGGLGTSLPTGCAIIGPVSCYKSAASWLA